MNTCEITIDPVEVARYMKSGAKPLEGGLLERVKTLIAEAPIDARGVWKAEGDAIYLCGTIGSRFDQWQRRLSVLGATDALIAQAIGAAAVEAVMDRLEAEAKAANPGEWGVRRSPGYGVMPLSDSAKIVGKLDATRRIGVAVTEDHLLVPTKSVTAVCSLVITGEGLSECRR